MLLRLKIQIFKVSDLYLCLFKIYFLNLQIIDKNDDTIFINKSIDKLKTLTKCPSGSNEQDITCTKTHL